MKTALSLVAAAVASMALSADECALRREFQSPQGTARENAGPLFWLHGTETAERLREYVGKVAESGQGFLVIESRPHKEWMREGWWRDVDIVIGECRRLGLKVMIFDDWWWPSQGMGGMYPIPLDYQCRYVKSVVYDARKTPKRVGNEITRIRVREKSKGVFDPAPDGDKVIVYNWSVMDMAHSKDWFKFPLVNGLDEAAVDWFLETFLKPYSDRYEADFKSGLVTGFFFDEPQTHGWWGPALEKELKSRKENIGVLLTALKHRLADPDAQTAALYRYLDARAEVWGRTMYGRQSDWCAKHGVYSSGHFREDNWGYYSKERCAGNVMQLLKYVTVPGVDIVSKDYYPEQRTDRSRQIKFGQVPKYASSAAHVYNFKDGLCWSEMFGAYGQHITYPQMKWLCDGHVSRGCYRMIPHSFNPSAPFDKDCPPYFYNGGCEPRYPLFRVWADYANRCAMLLADTRHVCRIAQCLPGISFHVGKTIRPEMFAFAIQDAQLDSDWMGYDAVETARIERNPYTGRMALKTKNGLEYYDILSLPATECVPFAVLEKALEFVKTGGVVIGYGIKPCRTPTRGKTADDVRRVIDAIFSQPTALFLEGEPDSAILRAALAKNYPGENRPFAIRELEFVGLSDADARMLALYQCEKDGKKIFFVANQDCSRPRNLSVCAKWPADAAAIWDPMRGTAEKPSVENGLVKFSLEPSEAAFIVYEASNAALPPRNENPQGCQMLVSVKETVAPVSQAGMTRSPYTNSVSTACSFTVRAPESGERIYFVCDGTEGENSAAVTVNGEFAGGFIGAPFRLDITRHVKSGSNMLEAKPFRIRNPRIVKVK